MEPSSPVDAQTPAESTTGSRRKSGRVTKKPKEIYSSAPAPAKRKRNEVDEADEQDGANADDASDEEEDEESDEESPDEEEIRETRRRKTAARKNKPQKKPAAKKSKPNGEMSLAIRPAGKPKKAKKPRPSKIAAAEEVGGLYADVFASGDNLNDVAARWLHQFDDNNSHELAELINFVLRCAGCDSKVEEHDMEDPDNCDSKLNDIQEEYQAQNNVDYPLIAKGKGTANFRHNMVGFFSSLVETLAESEMMYNNVEIMENIHIWLSTTSSGKSRPFRHTATAISVAIISALCEVGKKLVEKNSKAIRQKESEARRNKQNKGRVAELDQKSKQALEQQEKLEAIIRDWFDTVFVHRYRDVDPRIRLECVQGLSDWINTFPDLFFDGNHIRYLGWVLSDTSSSTRLEVVKQLQKLFKDPDKLGGLKTFTERFRPRMVEMATQDADPSVRAATVELLHILLEVGLLEPADIDSIGRLVFDVEPRVRKAVVGFVASNVDVMFDANMDELGGQEALEEALNTDNDDDFENPRLEWLKLKSLVENLQAYDEIGEDSATQVDRSANSHFMIAAGVESRIQVAAEALYDTIPELRKWEVIAGYLLYDHSQTSAGAQTNGATEDPETLFKQMTKLSEKDEILLLDILNPSVKLRLTHTMEAGKPRDQKSKLTKAQKESIQEEQEIAARHLAILIPQLLNKFGAVPDAASAVLRLEHVLNLDVFQELRQDSTTYSKLLDDINKQFMSHGHEAVLVEASRALLHAKGYEELSEVTEGKLQVLWEDTVAALHALNKGKPLSRRGNLSDNVLSAISNTVLRISNLANISDCVEQLEAPPSISPKKTKRNSANASESPDAIAILIDLVYRGAPNSETSIAQSATEDAIATHAIQSLMFYFLWKIRYWETLVKDPAIGSVPDDDVEAVALRRDAFVSAIDEVLRRRQGADEVRLFAAGHLIDLFTAFAKLRFARKDRDERLEAEREKRENAQTNGNGDHAGQQDFSDDFMALVLRMPMVKQKVLLQILGATERAFAKKASKNLLGPADEDEPGDIEDDPESSDDEESDAEDESEQRQMEKARAALLAERNLCELASRLVLAITAKVIDGKQTEDELSNNLSDDEEDEELGEAGLGTGGGPIRRRLERNKYRLGNNFKEVVAYLEAGHGAKGKKSGAAAGKSRAKSRAASSAPPPAARGKQQQAAKSAEIVVSDDEDDEEDEAEQEAEETRQRELEVHDEDEEMADDDGPAGNGEGEVEGEQESVLGD